MSINATGHLRKMAVQLHSPVKYELVLDDQRVCLSDYLGRTLHIQYEGVIHCVACGRKTNKSFNQGYCFPCMRSLAECDLCIVKPEQCHYFEGTCRNPEWGEQHCLQPHIVYLANSSGIKVGITRETQVPTRWIDQGAAQALPIFRVKNRLLSGLTEVILKKQVSDRTDWRRMLKGVPDVADLVACRDHLLVECADELSALSAQYGEDALTRLSDADVVALDFPVTEYPEKIKALNLDKTASVEGVLKGIKGQYLILDSGVFNVRKFAGYQVKLSVK